MNKETHDPYLTPQSKLDPEAMKLEYVGFWARTGASLIDTLLILLISYPILFSIYGSEYFSGETFIHGPMDVVLTYIFPAIAVITFWIYRSATPGKMVIGATIVDAKTGERPTTGQMIGRYFGYYPSTIALGLGLFWVGWDARKQGWHDKMAGTVVVRQKKFTSAEANFETGG